MSLTMGSRAYQNYVRDNWRCPPETSLFIMTVGLAGEVGEILEHVKKHVRDPEVCTRLIEGSPKREEMKLEFGDALHYFTRLAQKFGFTLEEIMAGNVNKLDERYGRKPVQDHVRDNIADQTGWNPNTDTQSA